MRFSALAFYISGIFFIVCSFIAAIKIHSWLLTYSYEKSSAQITAFKLTPSRLEEPNSQQRELHILFDYYDHSGRRAQGNRVSVDIADGSIVNIAEYPVLLEIETAYKERKSIDCFLNPEWHHDVVLIRQLGSKAKLFLVLSALFGATTLLLFRSFRSPSGG